MRGESLLQQRRTVRKGRTTQEGRRRRLNPEPSEVIFLFAHLNPENTEDDEEGAADEDNVADGFEGGDEGLHHQLQTWSSADHSGSARSNQTNVSSVSTEVKCLKNPAG